MFVGGIGIAVTTANVNVLGVNVKRLQIHHLSCHLRSFKLLFLRDKIHSAKHCHQLLPPNAVQDNLSKVTHKGLFQFSSLPQLQV